MDELVNQGLTLIEQFGAIAVLFMWLVWLIRHNNALKLEHQAEIMRLRQERDKANQDYIDLLTEIKVNRPVREIRFEDDERPTKRFPGGIDRDRLREAQEEEARRRGQDGGYGTD